MSEKIKEFLLINLENNTKASINRLQVYLSIGFSRAYSISTYLKENHIISDDSLVLLNKKEILDLDLSLLD